MKKAFEVRVVLGNTVGHSPLEQCPDELVRIELRGIPWEAMELPDRVALPEVTHRSALVLVPTVPKDHDAAAQVSGELAEKHGGLSIVRTIAPDLSLKYNRFYIGLAKDGQPSNFVIFRPKKDWVRIEPRLERSQEVQSRLEEAGLDVMEYDARWGRYRIRLAKGDVQRHESLLKDLLVRAYGEVDR